MKNQSKFVSQVIRYSKAAAPLVAGLVGASVSAHAGPIANGLSAIGLDITTGMRILGVGMLGWTGLRIFMDEHHSVNPGRVIGAVAGGAFAFAPTSFQTWMSGW